jgi:hypothetical protein
VPGVPKYAAFLEDRCKLESLTHGPYRVEFDREATVRAYAAMGCGGAEKCTCEGCQNFARHRPIPYPLEFLGLLERLGIDSNREIEPYELGPNNDHAIDYAGWFYFYGTAEGQGQLEIGPFTYFFQPGPAYAVKEFDSSPICRVEFLHLWLPRNL